MLHVWTSPPSKVPAYSMSAPVAVNRYRASAGSIFTAGSPLHSGFGAKERAAIAYVAVGDIWGLDDQVWGVGPPHKVAVFMCRPHSCLCFS
jgi:hypothetical protein